MTCSTYNFASGLRRRELRLGVRSNFCPNCHWDWPGALAQLLLQPSLGGKLTNTFEWFGTGELIESTQHPWNTIT